MEESRKVSDSESEGGEGPPQLQNQIPTDSGTVPKG